MIRALAHEQYSPPSHDAIAAFRLAERLRDVLGLATVVLGELLLERACPEPLVSGARPGHAQIAVIRSPPIGRVGRS